MCIITQVICILTHKSALRLSLPVCGVVFFLKYRLPVYPHSWIMMQLEGWEREKDGYPHTWQVKCSTVDFLDAGGTVCLDAFEFVPPWLSNIPLHEWVWAWMPVYTCYPVSYPGSNAWSAADTPPHTHVNLPPHHWQQLLQCCKKEKRWGSRAPLTLQQKTQTVPTILAHPRLLTR